MEIALLSALILLNGVFAMSEIALVTARKARLQKLIDEGDRAAAAAAKLGQDPTRFLSTIQIGITSIGVLNGIVGEAVLAAPLAESLRALGLPDPYAAYGATALVVIVITYVSIVVGELVPKRLGQTHPERLARLVARPIDWLAMATEPFVRLLSASTQALLRLLGVKDHAPEPVTEEEIHAMLAEGTSNGVIQAQEHAILRNVFRLDDRHVGSLMVPRADVAVLQADAPFEQNLARIEHGDHALYPVLRGGWDGLLGVVNARQWLSRALRGGRRAPGAGLLADEPLQTPLYVPETLSAIDLLDQFRSSDVHLAFVIDEYGEVQGIVTLQDLVEAIAGEFRSRDPDDSWAVQRPDGSWLLDGHIPIPELKDRLKLATVPDEDRGRYHTLSGLLMLLTGRVPALADTADWEGWRFEIVDLDGKTIDKVLASPVPAEAPSPAAATSANGAAPTLR